MQETVENKLFELADSGYRDFQAKLIPNIPKEKIIGVRMPNQRKLVKELVRESKDEWKAYLDQLPHKYYEEDNLHMLFLMNITDYEEYVIRLWQFLPFIDNWATNDIGPNKKLVSKNRDEYLEEIKKMLKSDKTYIIRFGIFSLMQQYLDKDFKSQYLELVAAVESDEYYVNMMIAWYFATALAKQWEKTIKYVEEHRLSDFCHRKTIQKAVESYRITNEEKEYLKQFR